LDVKLKVVTQEDWNFILKIRNEADVRYASFNTESINSENHFLYMKKLATRDNVYQRIITFEGNDAGYFKVIDDEVSYMLKKEFRGKGIMIESFKIAFEDLKKLGIKKLKASIKVDNYSSVKLVEKLGFSVCDSIYKENKIYSYIFEKNL
jgi:RimJ/RimL family protein N-acetyltransferase